MTDSRRRKAGGRMGAGRMGAEEDRGFGREESVSGGRRGAGW